MYIQKLIYRTLENFVILDNRDNQRKSVINDVRFYLKQFLPAIFLTISSISSSSSFYLKDSRNFDTFEQSYESTSPQ